MPQVLYIAFASVSKYVPMTFLIQHISLSFALSSFRYFFHATFLSEINKELQNKSF